MEDKIFEKIPLIDWRKYTLGEGQEGFKTDEFYCELANDLYEILRPVSGMNIIPSDCMHLLCIRLSQYMEDVVSGLGIFEAFRELNKTLDNRLLPFYNISLCSNNDATTEAALNDLKPQNQVYDTLKLNVEDIQLLIWDYVMSFNPKKEITSPFNSEYKRIATELKLIMDDAYINAPANEELKNQLYPKEDFTSFEQVNMRLRWMSRGCYLTSSYTYNQDLSYARNVYGRVENDEGEEFRWFTKFTPEQNKLYFSELLIFQKTTRLLSLPFTEFYGMMLKNNGSQKNASLVEEIEANFQKFRVRVEGDGKMHFQSLEGKEYVVDIPQYFIQKVENPKNIGFIIGSLVKFGGVWSMGSCRKYAFEQEANCSGEVTYWNKSRREYEDLKVKVNTTYEAFEELQKDKVLGFYQNYEVCLAQIIENGYLEKVNALQTVVECQLNIIKNAVKKSKIFKQIKKQYNSLLRQGLEVPQELLEFKAEYESNKEYDIKKLQAVLQRKKQELSNDLNNLENAKKVVKEYKIKTPINPIVVFLHKDKTVTYYKEYVEELAISSNPYASNCQMSDHTVEYRILHYFDYDLAKAVLKDPTLKVSPQNINSEMNMVRSFVVENVEFITRYCYHKCFSDMAYVQYKYPQGSVLIFNS